ncbi:MAG: ATP-binding protein, partial [Thermoanaerobaculia bacterium]
IWHHSPLARGGVLSALVVFSGDRPVSRFAFGLPMSEEEGEVDWTPTRWPQQVLPSIWQDAVISGEADMASNGEPWGWVRYWLWPQPGFRLGGSGLDVLAAGLLRDGPVAGRLAPGPSRYALYSDQGEAVIVPWNDTPPLEPSLLDGGELVVATPAGRAWAFAARGEDGVRVLYLPIPRTMAALERVGIHVVSVLIVLLVLGMTSLPALLPRRGLRQTVGHALRSYSKRLVVVYSLLLTVPLLAMNATVLRMVEKRLQREQRAAGQAALESAQRVLGEYVLSLEPGFGFESALDDELLIWLSGVVHHEVNLYWRSSVLASSKPELFTAGLLPSRIPGEIYSRLTLLGHSISSRVNEAGGVDYLELYAPLKVPGVPGNQARLFLSTPLSAQQKEVSAEVAELRRKALLGTTLLMLLLVAIGTRFARSFTTPLQEIVQGTQRIAAGEASLKLAPRESELATLVEAIDQMAARIAEGRRSLLREKRVVERIVESITSGVVSLDGEGRVLMRNRVAAELLGVEVGEALAEALQREARLGSVYEFVDSAGERTQQGTVGLREESGDEREWSLVWVPLPGEGEPAALLVVEDVTEVLRGQRLQAWEEMARIIAHEIKNPLTPIRLSAEHMTRVYHSDPEHFEQVFESCTSNILRQVEELQQISSEFSTYSQIPRIELTEGDLAAAAAEVVEGYRAAPPKGVKISFSAEAAQIPARFDAKLLRRAVRNLVENALQATSDGGEVRVEVGTANGRPRISVIDTGPGVAAEVLPRIFDPYFSTYDTGTGLGLPIAKRIAEEHGGQISARNRPEGGLEVTIFLGAPPSTP